jgi:isopentenyl-diphosphate Delta-isomerase
MVDVVDELDNILYSASLRDCKAMGLLHRAVAIFLINSSGEILLQQRSFSDDWLPGKWTISATGHVRAGENPSDASIRELKEELGITGVPTLLFKQLIPKIESSAQIEYELTYAFRVRSDLEPRINLSEVGAVRFEPVGECRRLILSKRGDFTPDSILILERYLQSE